MPHQDPKITARLAEIAMRERWKSRERRKRFTLRPIRIKDLRSLIEHRYGTMVIPDTDDGHQIMMILAHHIAFTDKNPRGCLFEFFDECIPWASQALQDKIMAETLIHPKLFKANTLGWRLHITESERQTLKITTISVPGATIEKDRKERAKQRMRALRAKKGATPRKLYEANSLERLKPWQQQGISRRTYFRRKARQ